MKKLFILLLLSGLSSLLKAQPLPQRNHFLQPDFYTKTLDGAVLANGNLVVVCSAGNRLFFGSDFLWLACFGPDGSLVWSKPAQLGAERLWSASILPLPDSNFVVQYEPSGCDFGQPASWAYFNAEGARLWHSTQEMPWTLPMWPYDAHTFVVGDFIAGYLQLGYDGQEVSIVNFLDFLPPLDQGYIQMSSGNFLMTSNQSKLHLLSPGLFPLNEKTFGKTIEAVDTIHEDELAVLFSDSLFILNADWEPTAKAALPYTGKKMAVAGERIFVYTEKNSFRFLVEFDHNLQIVNQLPLSKEVIAPRLSAPGNDLLYWGTSNWQDQNPALYFKTIAADSPSFDETPDLAVIDIGFLDTIYYNPVSWGGPGIFRQIDFGEVVVSVKNEGATAVETYQLNIKDLYCPGICAGEINLTRPVNTAPLQPGEVEKVTFDKQLYYDCTYSISELCIWVNGPDEMPDAAPENNRFCKSFVSYLGAEEALAQPNISVYPNPSTGDIHLSGLKEPVPYRLFNAHGQWIRAGMADSETLDFSELPEGLYLIQLELPEKKFGYLRFLMVRP